jgi:hypothetical protein
LLYKSLGDFAGTFFSSKDAPLHLLNQCPDVRHKKNVKRNLLKDWFLHKRRKEIDSENMERQKCQILGVCMDNNGD